MTRKRMEENKEANHMNQTAEKKVHERKPKVKEHKKIDDKDSQKKDKQKESVEEDSIEKQLLEYKDKYLRLSAEFDNYRKRTLKEKIELTKTASEEILIKLLPVIDDFERGLTSMETAKDINAVKKGVELIYNKIGDILKQQGVKEIKALEEEFNMDIHEAVTKIPAPKAELKGKVVDVIEKGYYLHDKVLRYPKVVVGE